MRLSKQDVRHLKFTYLVRITSLDKIRLRAKYALEFES